MVKQLLIKPGDTVGITDYLLQEANIRGLEPQYIACGEYEMTFIHLAKDALNRRNIPLIPERVAKPFCLQLLDKDHNVLCEVNAEHDRAPYVLIINEKTAPALRLPLRNR